MSITTYDELKAAVTSWLKRDDLTIQAGDFITLAESHFNRVLRTTEMETRSQATANSEFIGLPDDFLSLREIHLESNPDKPLKYISPQELTYRDFEGDTGTPYAYSIMDGQIKLYPAPSAESTVDLEIIYIQKIPSLSDSNTTNWLLDSHPDIYLFGALSQAEGFLYNDQRIAVWDQQASRAIETLNNTANKARSGTGPLIPRVRNIA
jgi:hypothetical protein